MNPLVNPPSKVPIVDAKGRNSTAWIDWLNTLYQRLSRSVAIQGYVVADLTTANNLAADQNADATFTKVIYVTDATGGATTAYSDGTDWISHKTGAAV